MKQYLLTLLTVLSLLTFTLTAGVTPAYAIDCSEILTVVESPTGEISGSEADSLTVEVSGLQGGGEYTLRGVVVTGQGQNSFTLAEATAAPDGKATFTYNHHETTNSFYGTEIRPSIAGPAITTCDLPNYLVTNEVSCNSSNITIRQDRDGQECFARQGVPDSCLEVSAPMVFSANGITQGGSLMNGQLEQKLNFSLTNNPTHVTPVTNGRTDSWVYSNTPNEASTFTAIIQDSGVNATNYCEANFSLVVDCQSTCLQEEDLPDVEELESDSFALCDQLPNSPERGECIECAGGEDGTGGVWTAIGCISREPQNILTALLGTSLTIGGGIALLMILGAGFIFTTSSGDPKRVDQAKELITSAVIGLIFIIFSVTILEFIGFTVLKIPGFGG